MNGKKNTFLCVNPTIVIHRERDGTESSASGAELYAVKKGFINIPIGTPPSWNMKIFRHYGYHSARPTRYEVEFIEDGINGVSMSLDWEEFKKLVEMKDRIYMFFHYLKHNPTHINEVVDTETVVAVEGGWNESIYEIGDGTLIIFIWNTRNPSYEGRIKLLDCDSRRSFQSEISDFCYFLRFWAPEIEKGVELNIFYDNKENDAEGHSYKEIGRTENIYITN